MHPNTRATMVPMAGAVAVAVSLMLAGCSAAESFDKAGGSGPVALRMANVYGGLNLEPGVQAFVDAVDTASDGSMSIDVVSDWGSYPPDAEQQLVADVAGGEADLGWTGTRVFDLLDVSAFEPQYFHEFDVSADGQRFLFIRAEPDSRPTRIDVILNWFPELAATVPAS